MTNLELTNQVKRMIASQTCCEELREAGKKFLAAEAAAAAAAKKLLDELKEDVCSIDSLIDLTATAQGEQIFGKEQCQQMHVGAVTAKNMGIHYCLCDACTHGGRILDDQSALNEFLSINVPVKSA